MLNLHTTRISVPYLSSCYNQFLRRNLHRRLSLHTRSVNQPIPNNPISMRSTTRASSFASEAALRDVLLPLRKSARNMDRLKRQETPRASPKKVVMKSPVSYQSQSFQLCYIRNHEEANAILKTLLHIQHWSFDMEWKVVFKKGMGPQRTAVIQMGCEGKVLVLHIHHMQCFPEVLRNILEDSTKIKYGLNVRGDANKLFKDYQITVTPILDIGKMASSTYATLGRPSLAALSEAILGRVLPKGKVRCSNWERDILTQEQQEYAANDVFAAWCIFEQLRKEANVSEFREEFGGIAVKESIVDAKENVAESVQQEVHTKEVKTESEAVDPSPNAQSKQPKKKPNQRKRVLVYDDSENKSTKRVLRSGKVLETPNLQEDPVLKDENDENEELREMSAGL